MDHSSSGYIPDHKIDEVRLASDIVTVVGQRVRLTKKGKDYWGLCPFHGDKDPSFKVDRQRGTWYCFGCGEGGSVFNFIMKDQGLSFPEAVRELARRFGVELPKPKLSPEQKKARRERESLRRVLELAQNYFTAQLGGAGGKQARDYIARRGLESELVRKFGLGWAPDEWEGLGRHLAGQGVDQSLAVKAGLLVARDSGRGCYDRFRGRVVFPIRDITGNIISFGGRVLDSGEPKYLNGPESPLFNKSANLYNLDLARQAMRKQDRALVVEGYFDVITCAAHGFWETVAPLGTALTSRQVMVLKRQAQETVLVFDGDQAGLRAAKRALPLFLAEDCSPKVLLLPQGEDPDSFLRSQGAQALEEALGSAKTLVEAVLDGLVEEGDLGTPEGRSRIVADAGGVIKAIKDPVAAWLYLERLAHRVSVPPEMAARRLGMPLPRRSPARVARPAGNRGAAAPERCLLELALASASAARRFMSCGVLEGLEDQRLDQVASAMRALMERGQEPTPDAVSQAVADPDLAGLVVRLSERAPCLNEAEALEQAKSMEANLARRRAKAELRRIAQAMAAAHAAGDAEQVALLQKRRKELTTNSPPLAGKD